MKGHEGLEQMLTQLRLARVREVYRDWIEQAAQTEMSYQDFLVGLCEEELLAREEKGQRRRLKQANFPFQRTLEQFDFRYRPELKRQVFVTYLEESFITEGRSLTLVGRPGTGKTHLGIAIGVRHIQRGYDVRFTTVQRLLNRCLLAADRREQEKELRAYLNCDLLILDELGYLPLDPAIGPILYELIAGRYERRAVIVTSNKSLTEWGEVLHDGSLAAALIDRLVHHGEVYYLRSGSSYRLRGKQVAGAEAAIDPGGEDQPSPGAKTPEPVTEVTS